MPNQKKVDIWVEMSNMDSIEVRLEEIYLDPNNPRLETPGKEKQDDKRIGESGIQQECLQQIRNNVGIDDLFESIKTSGFWTIDRIVLRAVDSAKYVVIEGNRRVAALMTLKDSHEKGKITLAQKIYEGILKFEALLYKGNHPDIAWIVQGFRHTPGIKSWNRYPKAKFLAEFERNSGKSPREISSIFGIKPTKEVTHLIRSYYAFEQAKQDEDYGDMLNSDKFGHFDEIILVKEPFQKWMGWNDDKQCFIKTDNLKKYLSWVVGAEGKPKIDISPTTRDVLPKLVQPENSKILELFDEGKLTIEECKEKLFTSEIKRRPIDISDIITNLDETKKVINTLPIPQLQLAKTKEEKEQKKRLIELLEELSNIIIRQIKNIKKG